MYWIDKKMLSADDNFAPPGPDYTHKREAGQLVLLRIPGVGGGPAATNELAADQTNEGAAQAAPRCSGGRGGDGGEQVLAVALELRRPDARDAAELGEARGRRAAISASVASWKTT